MKNKKEKNKIIYLVLYGIIIVCLIYIVYSNNLLNIGKAGKQENNQASKMSTQEAIEDQKENINLDKNEEQVEQMEEENNQTNNTQEGFTQQDSENKDKIPDKMGGYEVLGKLVIEKVNINKNILGDSNDEALKVSTVKLYGPNINEIGNFCICGHNWNGMLKRALELKVGDTFYLIDKKTMNKVNYKIYNIYTCMPKDLDCLKQNTEGRKEATIITCNPGGVTRLIIKGRAI